MIVRKRAGWAETGRTALASALIALPLAACSADKVLDAVNPVTWYHDIVGTDAPADQKDQANLEAGSKEDYPNLSTVPDEPTRGLTEEQRKQLTEGLIADRDHARYTDEQVRAGDAGAVMPAPAVLPEDHAGTASGPHDALKAPADAPGPRVTPEPEIAAAAPPPPSLKPVPAPTPATAAPGGAPAAPAPPAQTQIAAAAPVISGSARHGSTKTASVVFAPGASDVPTDEAAAIAQTAARHKEAGRGMIRVVGYAAVAPDASDPTAQQLAAYQAALARANNVKAALVQAGVPTAEIVTEATPLRAGTADPDHADLYVEQ